MDRFRCGVVAVLGMVTLLAGFGGHALAADSSEAMSGDEALAQREEALRQQLKGLVEELDDVRERRRAAGHQDASSPVIKEHRTALEPGAAPEVVLHDVAVISDRVSRRPAGITESSTMRSEHESQPTRHLRESLESIPGIVPRQEHGGREVNLSIRGSGNKTGCCVRNIKMYEDGFSVTQPDGTARPELHDPWFLQSIVVRRGPSSSLYDNYALGGMVHLRTRRGRDIDGVETFVTAGSYGYHKEAIAIGKEYGNLDIALFSSYQREDGWRDHSQ